MILTLHILIATMSLIYSTYIFFVPSIAKLKRSFLLVILTGITGVVTGIVHEASITRLCTSGVVYAIWVSVLSIASSRSIHKLSPKPITNNQ